MTAPKRPLINKQKCGKIEERKKQMWKIEKEKNKYSKKSEAQI